MSTFDPRPNAPHGVCLSCSVELATETDAREHMNQTLSEAKARGEEPRSHRVRTTNPSRASRIRSRLSSIIEDATERAMEEMDRLADRGDVTEAEIATALRGWPDFQEAREDWVAEEAS